MISMFPIPVTFIYNMSFPFLEGEYGDNLNEMSWAVGEVLDTLRKLEIEKNTLVLFVSDHGGHIEICSDGGKNSPFRGKIFVNFEDTLF